MKTLKVLIIGIIVLFSVSGCSAIGNLIKSDPIKQMLVATVSGTLEHVEGNQFTQATPIPARVIMTDDFSDPSSGWEIFSDDYGSAEYIDGTYQVSAIQKNEYSWGIARQNFDNIRIDVDMDVLETNSTLNDGFGVDCRIQDNGDGYGFRISSDGYAAIELFNDKEGSDLAEWELNDAVLTDGSTNHITAICDGSQLTLLVNDVQVATAVDSTFSKGDVALSVISYEEEPITVSFDNFEVRSTTSEAANTAISAEGDYSLEISNPTDLEVCGLFIVPSTEEFWNDNFLVDGETIAPGESKTFSGFSAPSVDIRAETCDFFTISEAYEIDLSTTSSFSLTAPRLLLHQPFDNIEGWPSGIVDGGMVANSNGKVYSLTVTEADKLVTASGNFSGQDLVLFSNASLVKAGGNDMGIYGITCRMRPDGSGIFFAIRGDGMASIIGINAGEMEQLTDWGSSKYINAGAASNSIEADCLGSEYTMFVNGDYIGSVEDSRFQTGKVGVAVFSPAGESTQADFDFLDVYAGE